MLSQKEFELCKQGLIISLEEECNASHLEPFKKHLKIFAGCDYDDFKRVYSYDNYKSRQIPSKISESVMKFVQSNEFVGETRVNIGGGMMSLKNFTALVYDV